MRTHRQERKRQKGVSIAEILVASMLFGLVMLVGLGALQMVHRTNQQLKGRSEARQQLRTLLAHLKSEVRAATFVFHPNQSVDFGHGVSHAFSNGPPEDTTLPASPDLLFAVTEVPSLPPSFVVEGLYLTPETHSSPSFVNAHQIVLGRVPNAQGATPGSPADIVLSGLATAGSDVKTFRTASPSDGLKVSYGETLDSLVFEIVIGHKTESSGIQFETYQSRFTMRNNR